MLCVCNRGTRLACCQAPCIVAVTERARVHLQEYGARLGSWGSLGQNLAAACFSRPLVFYSLGPDSATKSGGDSLSEPLSCVISGCKKTIELLYHYVLCFVLCSYRSLYFLPPLSHSSCATKG